MSNRECIIVIPVHSAAPSALELISFRQCYKILGAHPITLIAPAGLNLDEYRRLVPDLDVIYIPPYWQASLLNYNKLKASRFFYNLFQQYEFLLTYELDAFVFKDELTYWCQQGFDFIGAPWFEGYIDPVNNKLIGVGNSGFSLRNIQTARKLLKKVYYRSPEEYGKGKLKRWKAYLKEPYRRLRNLGKENYSIQLSTVLFEDAFFCYTLPAEFKEFQLAPVEEALKFSFEVKPEYLFNLTNNQLPMGCHAWWRYNLKFWAPFIESYGYSLPGKELS